ncbi:PAS domain S-box protein [Methylocystis iwaonis]|uniref:histidine kinase n=1 Tax=Methylocystis iwaonis TaxID=2885079 RepID=A0ABM8EC63_9HYPH|nr:PAS domain S-box protein [Methylocystis iwaonis]BDV35493.1 hypothetical protein SS37A_30220 [Methylocystis iwaonis]
MRQAGALDLIFQKNAVDKGVAIEAVLVPFLDLLPQECLAVDRSGVIVAINEKWARNATPTLLGAPVQIGCNLFEAFGASPQGSDGRRLLDGLEAIAGGAAGEITIEYLDGSGEEGQAFVVEAKHSPLTEGGAILTRSRHAASLACDAAVRDSEAQFRAMFERAGVGMAQGDLETGRLLRVNETLANMLGYDISELVGRPFGDFTYPDDRAGHWERLTRMKRGETAAYDAEKRCLRKDGTHFWARVTATSIRTPGKEKPSAVTVVQDISLQRQVEGALRKGEERQAFLLKCADALRQIADPRKIQETGCRLLAEYLRVERVFYADIEGEELVIRSSAGAGPCAGRTPIASLGVAALAAFQSGEAFATEDISRDERLSASEKERLRSTGVAALLCAVLTKQGQWVGALCAQHGAPRAWTPFEIALIQEVGERVWAACERARAQEALRESEFRLQLALSSGNVGIYEWRIESDELIWDDWLRKKWNLPAGATVSYALFLQGVHAADRERVQHAVERSLDPESGGSLSLEYRLARPDQAERWIATTGAVFFENGRPIRMVGTAQDVTERKRAEAERQKFVSLAEQSMEFIGICSLEFEPLYINPAGARLVGLEREKAPHTPIQDYFFPEDRAFVFNEFHACLMRDDHANVEIRFRHFKTGEALWMLYNVFVLRDEAGARIGLATVSRDITARKRAEDALKAADRRKDEFLATLAHELRNPLAPIRNAVHILRHDVGETTKGKRDLTLLSMVDRQVEHLIRLVDDLLEVSRITRGKIELKKRRIDLGEVLRHAIETAQPMIDAGGHELKVELPSEPMELDADPVRLAQVFTNLLNNAAKYTEQGGIIELVAERRGREAAIAVRDSGVGIPPEMLPRVFDLFTQVDRSLGRAQGGLGIGLALVKSLLRLHGGTVEAHSDGLGRGSVFLVRLPIGTNQSSEAPMPATTGVEASGARRILVIDDDHDVADSLVMFLETFGADVRVAYSGLDGVEAVKAFEPELVFLDLGMPGMDGYETARRIRALPNSARITLVALTGWGQDQIRDRAREAGFDRQLTKPAGLDALQDLLGSL